MNTKNKHNHCPEVEDLMGGKMPFVTRYGILLVTLVILIIMAIMLLSDGPAQQLGKELIMHTVEQMTSRFK